MTTCSSQPYNKLAFFDDMPLPQIGCPFAKISQGKEKCLPKHSWMPVGKKSGSIAWLRWNFFSYPSRSWVPVVTPVKARHFDSINTNMTAL